MANFTGRDKEACECPLVDRPFPDSQLLYVAALAGEPGALRKTWSQCVMTVLLPGMYPKGSVSSYGDACSSVSTVALLMIARR